MTSKSPVFTISESRHFSDYGFDQQFDYFQVLEEARKHKHDTSSSIPIDTLHFKLQKPTPEEDSKRSNKSNKRAKWWRNVMFFFKTKLIQGHNRKDHSDITNTIGPHHSCTYNKSLSGPVYITESLSGGSTPYRTTSRPSSGPLTKGELDIPYMSLKELNVDPPHRISASAMPIYLVT